MAVVQISRIQHRRGLESDLPNLASAELGWSVDTRKLYIGNGTIEEGAPSLGRTEILTQYSILDFQTSFTANIVALQANVVSINANLATISNAISTTAVSLAANAVSATAVTFSGNNGIINYTLNQGSKQRTGTITYSTNGSSISYNEEYTETATTDIVFTMNAVSGTTNLNYSSTTAANLRYRTTTAI